MMALQTILIELGLEIDLRVEEIIGYSTPGYNDIRKILEEVTGHDEHKYIWSNISNEKRDQILIKDG